MLTRSLDKPRCGRRSLLDRLRALLRLIRHDARCDEWFEDLPPDSFVREPRRPLRPSSSGSVALEPPPDLA
jgi:hypothetical protein